MADTDGCYDQSDLGCVLYFAFCHPVPLDLGAGCYNAAVCQKGNYQDSTTKELNLGSFTNFTAFYSSMSPRKVITQHILS